MGGAQFYWRITLVKGSGKDGSFDLAEATAPLGPEVSPEQRIYRDKGWELTHDQLVAAVPYAGDEVGRVALGLTAENPRVIYKHVHHMAI